MMADIWTTTTKEWKEVILQRGNLDLGWLSLIILAAIFGVYLPLQVGPSWVESPASLLASLWVVMLLVASVIADSFAGERERHTLETLLASRLSDRAILLGKIGAAVGYAWVTVLALLLVGLVAVNAAYGGGRLIVYPLSLAVGAIGLSFLAATLISGVGVLVSLHAATVRQAAQTLSVAVVLLLAVPAIGLKALPEEIQQDLIVSASGLDATGLVAGLGAVLLVLDAGLLLLALGRFQRAKLILR